MRRALISLCVSALLIAASAPAARPYTYQFTASSQLIRWNTSTINIQLSTSLRNPPANIRAGSDVEGAARRALQRWSEAANINFNITVGGTELAIDDNVNVISVSAANAAFVGGGERTGRARVEFDPNTGFISEADMAVNPNQPFSTDGTHDTFDLEATFVHEIGHMLGLDHSGVVGATMQPRQVRNFLDLKQPTPRTLSDDDIAGIRSLYNRAPRQPSGSIAGGINYTAGAHVFAENVDTGRVHGSSITQSNGTYRIDHLPAGNYRVVVEYLNEPVFVNEITSSGGPYAGIGSGAPFQLETAQTSVAAGATSTVNFTIGGAPFVNLRRHGLVLGGTAIVHGGPMPVTPGASYRYYVAGEGVDQIPAANFSFTTPFITLDPASRTIENPANFGLQFPLVSFNIRVADTAKVGDYSLRAQATSGEVAYLTGAVVVDPYTDRAELNPIDAHDFFVRQQYRDFLFREPDAGGFNAWLNVLTTCPNAFNTDRSSQSAQCDRNLVSSSFFRSREFEQRGRYIFHFYRVGLNRSPTYAEFIADMQFLTRPTEAEVIQQINAYPARFTGRADFQATLALPNDQYVNTLMDRYGLQSITTPDPANPNGTAKVTLTRADLVGRLNAGTLTKAQVLRAVADSDQVSAAEFNRSFVTMQYFGYLRRDPDPSFTGWLNLLNANPTDFYTMVNGFVNSQEYRTRFGQP
ncbi:MAG TPA: matrixin family metalloprotease [Pyrinomonadaceae bacterium]